MFQIGLIEKSDAVVACKTAHITRINGQININLLLLFGTLKDWKKYSRRGNPVSRDVYVNPSRDDT